MEGAVEPLGPAQVKNIGGDRPRLAVWRRRAAGRYTSAVEVARRDGD